jgi:hypothetical protein
MRRPSGCWLSIASLRPVLPTGRNNGRIIQKNKSSEKGRKWSKLCHTAFFILSFTACIPPSVLINCGIFIFCQNICFTAKTQHRKFETKIPRKGIARPQSQCPHSCVCKRLIYSQDRSAYISLQENMGTDPGIIYKSLTDT